MKKNYKKDKRNEEQELATKNGRRNNRSTGREGKTGRTRTKDAGSNCNSGSHSGPGAAVYGSTDNDFSWYNTLPELTSAAARFPFSRPTGTPITYSSLNSGNIGVSGDKTGNYLPGIMAIHWNPTIGVSTDPLSSVNTLSREIYSFVRHANSGSANYDAPDLTLYLLAMDSIYSMYSDAVRVYGLANMYTKENRYMPKALIEALGYDFNDILGNLAQFRWAINQIAYKISSLAVPNFMSYYLRHMWMNSGVYTDKDSAKAQLYTYVQDGVYVFTETYNNSSISIASKGWALQFMPIRSTQDSVPFTVSGWVNLMQTMINPLLASEEIGIMSGDILKAFGMDNLFTVNPIPVDAVIVPAYSEEVLAQITNLTVIGRMCEEAETTGFSNNGIIYSSDIFEVVRANGEGYLYTSPIFRSYESGMKPDTAESDTQVFDGVLLKKLVTSDKAIPDEAEVMVNTRLTNTPFAHYTLAQNKQALVFDVNCPCSTEVVASVIMHVFQGIGKDQTTRLVPITLNGLNFSKSHTIPGDVTTARILTNVVKFDWAPTIPIYQDDSTKNLEFVGYYQDTDNYAVMDTEDLRRLHEAALLSEFYIPQVSSLNRKPSR